MHGEILFLDFFEVWNHWNIWRGETSRSIYQAGLIIFEKVSGCEEFRFQAK